MKRITLLLFLFAFLMPLTVRADCGSCGEPQTCAALCMSSPATTTARGFVWAAGLAWGLGLVHVAMAYPSQTAPRIANRIHPSLCGAATRAPHTP